MDIIIIIVSIILLLVLWIIYKTYSRFAPDPKDQYIKKDFYKTPIIDNETTENKNCVCAFDIDHTITCGNPKPYIDMCIKKGCRLAINTARPVKYIEDVDIDSLNFVQPHYNDSDFYYNPSSYSQTASNVAEVKSGYLELLKNKYNIKDKKCVVLLDDAPSNIKTAKEHGYSTIKAEHGPKKSKNCGLKLENLNELEDILNLC